MNRTFQREIFRITPHALKQTALEIGWMRDLYLALEQKMWCKCIFFFFFLCLQKSCLFCFWCAHYNSPLHFAIKVFIMKINHCGWDAVSYFAWQRFIRSHPMQWKWAQVCTVKAWSCSSWLPWGLILECMLIWASSRRRHSVKLCLM